MRQIAVRLASIFSVKNEKGVTAVEYGLLAALILLSIIAAVTLLGTNLDAVYDAVAAAVVVPS